MKLTIINEENDSKLTINNVDQETIDKINNDNTINSSLVDNELTVTANSINILCILFGHAWVDNVCVRCGATR